MQQDGKDPFKITKYDVTNHSAEIKSDFEAFESEKVSVAGRMMSKRVMGKASFCNVQDVYKRQVIDTTEEDYYKWTQWIFLKMFEHGLVFRDKTLVNYCPSCKVVLSNEDSQGGKCDICHSDVVQKSKDVWYLRITEYADKLLDGLKTCLLYTSGKYNICNFTGRKYP